MNPIRHIAPAPQHQILWALGLAFLSIILAASGGAIGGVVLFAFALAFFVTYRTSSDSRHDPVARH